MEYPELGILIEGEWIRNGTGRDALQVLNPATGIVLGELPVATSADVQGAIDAADRAFKVWGKTPAVERARLLQRIAALIRDRLPQLARILTLEQGKTLHEASGEITSTADTFEWMAEESKRIYGRVVPARSRDMELSVLREPVGPVGAFAPWNYPAVLSARKIAPALAAGCTVVIKPAEETPGILVAIGALCVEAGLPKGVLNIVFGRPAEISAAIISSPKIKHLSFTGSVAVGRHLATLSAQALKKITLELGGHSAAIIDKGIDVDRAVDLSVLAKFRNAGQICHAPARFVVHESLFQEFTEKFSRKATGLRVGNGLSERTQMGPLIHSRRCHAMQQLTEDALGNGAELACGGGLYEYSGSGNFWQPTVLVNANSQSRVMQEEVFGPIASMHSYSDLDEAICLANSTNFGLAAYGFSESARAISRMQCELDAGSLAFNTYAISSPEMPFSGRKDSGNGSEAGPEGLAEYLEVKSVIKAFN